MKKFAASFLVISIALLCLSTADARIAPLRVVFISGSDEYESDKTMPILKKYLEGKYPSVVTMVSAKSKTDLPGLESLEKCDVAVLFTRRLTLEGDQLARLKKYCQSGKPLVGIRTSSHAVQTWLELDKEVFGGNYKGHFGNIPTQVKFTENEKRNSILEGVKPFTSKGSLYKNTGLSKDVFVLMTGVSGDHEEPITWTRTFKGGRIFYTSLGHQKDFEEENFLRLMSNAILWAADRTPRKRG